MPTCVHVFVSKKGKGEGKREGKGRTPIAGPLMASMTGLRHL